MLSKPSQTEPRFRIVVDGFAIKGDSLTDLILKGAVLRAGWAVNRSFGLHRSGVFAPLPKIAMVYDGGEKIAEARGVMVAGARAQAERMARWLEV